MAIEIRTVRLEDSGSLTALVQTAPTAAQWSSAQVEEILRSETPGVTRRLLFVLEEDENVRGFIVGRVLPPECEVENIVVEPAKQGRGFGSLLLKELLEQARAAGCEHGFLEVRESNQAARRFYEKWGFRESGRRAAYYENPQEDAVLYACALSRIASQVVQT